jgi:hypothetical protein
VQVQVQVIACDLGRHSPVRNGQLHILTQLGVPVSTKFRTGTKSGWLQRTKQWPSRLIPALEHANTYVLL